LKIMLYTFVESKDWGVFLKERQWFFLEIMKKCKERGIQLAYPTQTLYVHHAQHQSQELFDGVPEGFNPGQEHLNSDGG